jgi:hypothetical protein
MNKKEDIGETTTLTPATTKSTSMRATVPMSIIKQFNLKAGDKLSWKLKIEGNRKTDKRIKKITQFSQN